MRLSWRHLFITIGSILVIFIFYALGRQVFNALRIEDRLNWETAELARLQQKNAELKKKLAEMEGWEFLEKMARNKLNMAREGETVVIIPDQVLEEVMKKNQPQPKIKQPNWQRWLRLFWK